MLLRGPDRYRPPSGNLVAEPHNRQIDAPDLFNKVTREDVQRVAKKYLTERNRTVATLVPSKPSEAVSPRKEASK